MKTEGEKERRRFVMKLKYEQRKICIEREAQTDTAKIFHKHLIEIKIYDKIHKSYIYNITYNII